MLAPQKATFWKIKKTMIVTNIYSIALIYK